MAVKFLNSLDITGNAGIGINLNNTEITSFKVDNVTADPSVTGEGQLIYRTDTNALKFYNGTSWVTLSVGGGSVTSVAQTHAGNAFSVAGSPITSAGTLAITLAGTSAQYIDGAGNLANISSLPQGDITGILAGVGLTGSNLSGPIPTLDVDYLGSDNVVLAASTVGTPVGADLIIFSDGSDSNVKTATISQIVALAPQGDITGVAAGTGMTGGGQSGDVTLNVIGGDGITANADDIAVDSTVVRTSGAQTIAGLKTFSTTPVVGTVNANDDSTSAASTAWVKDQNYTTSSGVTSINFTTDGTALNVNSNTITSTGTMTGVWQGSSAQYVNGAGDLTTFPAIPQGDLTGLTAGTYISISSAQGPVPTINALGTTAATASRLIARDASGYGYVVTPSSGDSSTKIATTAFVQSSLTGLLEFKGGFNASTGAIVAGGNLTSGGTRVAVAVGDYYVVTVAGNFFGNTATPLTVGDSVIVQTAAAVGTSVEADFIVVQSDTDLATISTVGIGNVNASTGIGVVYSNGTATITNTSTNVVQDLWSTFASDSGSVTTASATDTLTVTGAGGVTTAISGKVLTITGASAYSLPQMTATVRGGAELFSNTVQTVAAASVTTTASRTYGLQLNAANQLVVNVPWADTTVTYSAMNTTTLGLGRLRYAIGATPAANSQSTTAGRTYGVTKNASDQLIVNVPWSDNNSGGTVTSIATTGPITGGTITSTGTIGITTASAGTIGAGAVAAGTGISVAYSSGIATVTNTQTNSANTYAETITDTDLLIDHNLGTLDVMVQLYDVTTGNTVYADVDRISTSRIGVTFGSTPTNSVRVLVQKIG